MAKRTVTINGRLAEQTSTLEGLFDDMRVMLEARRADYLASAERVTEILQTLAPRPRVGRPRKTAQA